MPDRRDILRAALPKIADRLDGAGIWHCLAFGTLLGAVREADVIEWDHDLDLVVRAADVPRIAGLSGDGLVFEPIHMSGDRLALRPGGPGSIARVRVPSLGVSHDGVSVGELWAPVLFSDGVLRLYDLDREVALWPQSAMPAFMFDERRNVILGGRAYPAPAHAETMLEWLYGSDWQVPQRSVADGGDPVDGRGRSGDRVTPALAGHIAWCVQRGWDRSVYAGEPRWPRQLAGAGPAGTSDRAATTSGSDWWRTLDEVAENY